MKKTVIKNGRVVTLTDVYEDGFVVIEDGVITDFGSGVPEEKGADEVIDAKGCYVTPGFIDIHLHGGGDSDFMDGTAEAFILAAEAHAQYGTTAMFPTTLSGDPDEFRQALKLYDDAIKMTHNGAHLMGLHMEGPNFNMDARGAQDPKYVRDPDMAEVKEILSWTPHIKRWDIAPELPGALQMGGYLQRLGIVVSAGHTMADFTETFKAYENGYHLLTHFYACMTSIGGRGPNDKWASGMVEAGYSIKDMDVEIIADGKHMTCDMIKNVWMMKGADHTALITDASRAAASEVKKSFLGSRKNGQPIIVDDGVAKLASDGKTFAGSVATTDRLVRNALCGAAIPVIEVVKMASATPARIMHIDHIKGSIGFGKDADLVIFDDQVNIKSVMVGGKLVKHTL